MFKHTIGDDALKVIKTFSYTEGEDSNNWRVVMAKMEKHRIGDVNEIYERYCFNKRDKLPTESVDCFVAELKTLAKTCNFCDYLRDSLIRDRIVLGIKDEQTTKKLLRIRNVPKSTFTLVPCSILMLTYLFYNLLSYFVILSFTFYLKKKSQVLVHT